MSLSIHGLRHLVLCWVLPVQVQVFALDVRAHLRGVQGGVNLGWGQGRGRLSLVADFLITPSIKLLERKLVAASLGNYPDQTI